MDSITNRFFVLEGSEVPDEVRTELEGYQSNSAPTSQDTRGVTADVVINVLGGLISSAIWDQLPLWAAWWSGVGSTFRRAGAEEVTNNVTALCLRAGLTKRRSEIVIDQLIEVPRQGWSGRASVGAAVVSFRTDGQGRIIVFDKVSTRAGAVE